MEARRKAAESYARYGSFDKALENYEKLRELQQQTGDIAGEIDMILRITDFLINQHGPAQHIFALLAEAEVLQAKLEKLFPESLSKSTENITAEIYTRKVTVYRQRKEYEKALECINQIIALSNRTGRLNTLRVKLELYQEMGRPGAQQAEVMQAIVDLLLLEGQDPEALSYLREMLALFRQAGAQARAAETQNSIGLISLRQGDFPGAERAFLDAQETLQTQDDALIRALTANNRGALRYMLGQYDEAVEYLQQALFSLDRLAGRRALEAAALFSKAAGRYLSGRHEEAREQFEAALRALNNKDHLVVRATVLNHLALVHYKLMQQAAEDYAESEGLYRQAHARFQQARAAMRASGEAAGAWTVTNNLGLLDYSMGRIAEHHARAAQAEAYYRNALRAYQDVQAQDLGGLAGKSATLHNAGQVYASLERHDEAFDYLKQALALEEQIGNVVDRARTLAELGYLHERRREFERALDYYLQSIELQEEIRWEAKIDAFKISLAEQAVDVYQRAILLLMGMERAEEAFNLSERARARAFLDRLGNLRLDAGRGVDPQLRAAEQAQRRELANAYRRYMRERAKPLGTADRQLTQALGEQIEQARRRYKKILERMTLEAPEYASLISVNPLRLEQIQALLDEHTRLLSYFVTPELTLAFVIGKSSFEAIEIPLREQDLRKYVRAARRSPSTPDEPAPQSLENLYHLLVAPVKGALEGASVVGVIPHRDLHKLPFAALTKPTPGPSREGNLEVGCSK